jgi:hypothetical protein
MRVVVFQNREMEAIERDKHLALPEDLDYSSIQPLSSGGFFSLACATVRSVLVTV